MFITACTIMSYVLIVVGPVLILTGLTKFCSEHYLAEITSEGHLARAKKELIIYGIAGLFVCWSSLFFYIAKLFAQHFNYE